MKFSKESVMILITAILTAIAGTRGDDVEVGANVDVGAFAGIDADIGIGEDANVKHHTEIIDVTEFEEIDITEPPRTRIIHHTLIFDSTEIEYDIEGTEVINFDDLKQLSIETNKKGSSAEESAAIDELLDTLSEEEGSNSGKRFGFKRGKSGKSGKRGSSFSKAKAFSASGGGEVIEEVVETVIEEVRTVKKSKNGTSSKSGTSGEALKGKNATNDDDKVIEEIIDTIIEEDEEKKKNSTTEMEKDPTSPPSESTEIDLTSPSSESTEIDSTSPPSESAETDSTSPPSESTEIVVGTKDPIDEKVEELMRKNCKNRGEVFTMCGGFLGCQRTCDRPNGRKRGSPDCPSACIPGCTCPKYKLRNKETLRCVVPDECSNRKRQIVPKLPGYSGQMMCREKGEIFTKCKGFIGCQRTCNSPVCKKRGSPGCPKKCMPGCKCQSPKVRNEKDGTCIYREQCPNVQQKKEKPRGGICKKKVYTKCKCKCRKRFGPRSPRTRQCILRCIDEKRQNFGKKKCRPSFNFFPRPSRSIKDQVI